MAVQAQSVWQNHIDAGSKASDVLDTFERMLNRDKPFVAERKDGRLMVKAGELQMFYRTAYGLGREGFVEYGYLANRDGQRVEVKVGEVSTDARSVVEAHHLGNEAALNDSMNEVCSVLEGMEGTRIVDGLVIEGKRGNALAFG